ncbi:hypothetical protein TNCV_1268321 [Trichonephila clavipes]|nr:hypothetical protein TNCV_1268321 [Trichonephila clavipes]
MTSTQEPNPVEAREELNTVAHTKEKKKSSKLKENRKVMDSANIFSYRVSPNPTAIASRSGKTERGEKKKKKIGKTRAGRFRKAEKKDLGVLDRDADDESWTWIRKNVLRTVPRQAVERTT